MKSYTAENNEEIPKSKLVEIIGSAGRKVNKIFSPKRIVLNYLRSIRDVSVVALGVLAGLYIWEHAPKSIRKVDDPFKNETNIEKIVQDTKTWDGAREYLDKHMRYIPRDKIFRNRPGVSPFNIIHKIGGGVCSDYALAGYALLMDDERYECRFMDVELDTKNIINLIRIGFDRVIGTPYRNSGHRVCLVKDKETGKYGILGQRSESIRPTLDSPDKAFKALNFKWYFKWKTYELGDFDKSTVMYGKHILDKPKYCYDSLAYDSVLSDSVMNIWYSDSLKKGAYPLSDTLHFDGNSDYWFKAPEQIDEIMGYLKSRNFEERQKGIKMLDSLGITGFSINYGDCQRGDIRYNLKEFDQPFEVLSLCEERR
ncbi:hypothetical protein KY345_00970 [Candidatus Woesearchaeota archaeon]|nr:hypothetical protein [Candidatus Woesearchaeota archaeon]